MTYIITTMLLNIRHYIKFIGPNNYLKSQLEGLRDNASKFDSIEAAENIIDLYLPKDKEYCVDKY